jgi:hypothetical protein
MGNCATVNGLGKGTIKKQNQHQLSAEENCEQGLIALYYACAQQDGLILSSIDYVALGKNHFELASKQGHLMAPFFQALCDIKIGDEIELTTDAFRERLAQIKKQLLVFGDNDCHVYVPNQAAFATVMTDLLPLMVVSKNEKKEAKEANSNYTLIDVDLNKTNKMTTSLHQNVENSNSLVYFGDSKRSSLDQPLQHALPNALILPNFTSNKTLTMLPPPKKIFSKLDYKLVKLQKKIKIDSNQNCMNWNLFPKIRRLAIQTKNLHVLKSLQESMGISEFIILINSAVHFLSTSSLLMLHKMSKIQKCETGSNLWLYIAATLEDAVCQGLLAKNFAHQFLNDGPNKKRSFDLAIYWYERACKNGNLNSMENYAFFLLQNINNTTIHEKKGVYWLQRYLNISRRVGNSNKHQFLSSKFASSSATLGSFLNVSSLETLVSYFSKVNPQTILVAGTKNLLKHKFPDVQLFDLVHAGAKISTLKIFLCKKMGQNDYNHDQKNQVAIKLLKVLDLEKVNLYLIADYLHVYFQASPTLVNIIGNYLPWWANLFKKGHIAKQKIKIGEITHRIMGKLI